MIDLIGMRLGQLIVVRRGEPLKGGSRRVPAWECKCDCGVTTTVSQARLRSGKTKSCGCRRRMATRTHGHAAGRRPSKTYDSWQDMIARCSNPNNKAYANYGGRGIHVCERWKTFDNFLADMGERAKGMSIDRIDNDRGYEVGNCRWATRTEQNRNTRAVRLSPDSARAIRENPLKKTRQQLADEHGVSVSAIKAVRSGTSWSDI